MIIDLFKTVVTSYELPIKFGQIFIFLHICEAINGFISFMFVLKIVIVLDDLTRQKDSFLGGVKQICLAVA